MKYICINDFPNPQGNPIKLNEGQKHIAVGGKECIAHIHKGATFEIGTATEFAGLSPAEKTLVAHLVVSHKIAEATPSTIKRVRDEVVADDTRAQRDAELAKSLAEPGVAEILKALPAMISAAVNAKLEGAKK